MRKLVWFTLGFALATASGIYLLRPEMYFLLSGGCGLILAICLALMLRFPKMRIASMLMFGCIAGLLWLAVYDGYYLSVARQCDGQTVSMDLIATDASQLTDYGAATACKTEINGKSYELWVYHDDEIILSPGDHLTGAFSLRCTLPGQTGSSDYSRSNGVFLTARACGELTVIKEDTTPWYMHPTLWRISLADRIDAIFPADTAAFAKALLIGDTADIDYATDTALKVSGVRHVIAVSGLHVSILFSLFYFFLGRRKLLLGCIGLPALFIFAAIAGFSPSITRACIMHSLTVLALLLDKEYDPPSALCFAVLVMLLVNPWTVTNVGLQLSVGCMAGIFLFAKPMENWMMDSKRMGRLRGWRRKAAHWLAISVSITLSANVFTTFLSACYFGMVSIVAPITNLLILWIVTYLFYGIILALLGSFVVVELGAAVAWVFSWGIRYVLWIAKRIAAFPLAAVYTASIYIVFWLAFCYLLLVLFLLMRRKHPLILGICAALGLCIAVLASWVEPLSDDYRMTVLDVGQGQCILLQSEGKNYLVDCGGDSDREVADKAAALLLSQGIQQLDGLIITHYDADHAAGAVYLLQRIPVKTLYLPNSRDAERIAGMLYDCTDGDVIQVDRNVEIQFGPVKITLFPSENAETDNESGLCVLFQREECDILITGDRSAKGERELIENNALPQIDVLIVGHHGSKYSTCKELLIITQPEIAIVSVGVDNYYGHPAAEVLERLKLFDCIVLRTDLHGDIVYRG